MVSGQTSARTTQTAASHGVVQDYLDVLLRNVLPDEGPALAETESDPVDAPAQAFMAVADWPVELSGGTLATLAAAAVLPEAAAPEAPHLETLAVQAPDAGIVTPDLDPAGPLTATAPVSEERVRATAAWADKPFASLLFDVAGLKLAAPLHELGGIMPLADKLQPMAAQADWFMGLIRWNGRTIRVVDTARFVMPERIGREQALDYQSVVVLGDSHWALAVNNADQSVHLQPADIRWRKILGKRPWLAGTVLEHLCALLDVDVLIAMLDASDTAKQVKANLATQAG